MNCGLCRRHVVHHSNRDSTRNNVTTSILQVAVAAFEALSRLISASQATSSRRLLAGTLDLTSSLPVQELFMRIINDLSLSYAALRTNANVLEVYQPVWLLFNNIGSMTHQKR